MEAAPPGKGERECDLFLQVQMPEIEFEDWTGVHSLKNMPKSFKPQEPSTIEFSSLTQSLKTQEETKDGSSGKNRNGMTTLFCSPEGDETQKVLKHLFKKMKTKQRKFCPIPRYRIILVDAKDSEHLKQSFQKVAKLLDSKVDTKDLSAEEIVVKQIYKKMNIEHGPKDQSLFVFVRAKSLSEISPFLPKGGTVLPFCHFLVTTSSKTFNWESDSEKWTNINFLLFDKELIGFDWDGVHSASKLPASFQPVPDFAGRAEITGQLLERFQNVTPHPVPVQGSSRAARSKSFTLISGISGIGKTELVKKFLWTHPHLFAKVVLIGSESPADSLKIFAHNFGMYFQSEMEGATEADKSAFLYSEITKDLQGNQRGLFLFDNADSLEKIKNYVPTNFKRDDIICDVIVTSRSRNWRKEEDVKFYRDNRYDFLEIPLFDGLSLDETHEFCSKILPKHGILYLREDLERSVEELHKVTGGFPLVLQHLSKSISKSSRSNPEWTPNIHILNYLRRDLQEFRDELKPIDFKKRVKVPVDSRSSASKPSHGELGLLQVLCLMSPEHLDFEMICYFYFEHEKPFKPPPQKHEPEQLKNVKDMLLKLEMDSLVQVDRKTDEENVNENIIRVRVPAFLRESMNAENTDTGDSLRDFLCGSNLPHSSWTRPLDVPQLWPHILSLNESCTRFHGYHNQVLIECIKNHLRFWKNPPREEIPREIRPKTDFETERKKVKKLLEKNLDFKRSFGDFSQVEDPGFLLPLFFFLIFLLDVGTDVNNAIIISNYAYSESHFRLTLFLIIFPFFILCLMHYFDRKEYNQKMKNRRGMSWWEVLRMFAGPFDSYFLRFWYTWKFWRETGNLERGFLYERLCVLRANAEYHGIAEAFLESLPQLLLQFALYLLTHFEHDPVLRRRAVDSGIPFELGLVVSLFSFGLALTKLESVYFGWNMELFGLKRLGHHILHLLINVTHIAALVFCSGIVAYAGRFWIYSTPLLFCLTATAWLLFNGQYFVSRTLPNLRSGKSFKSSLKTGLHSLLAFFAPMHPGFLDKGGKLESASKREFVTAKLGHDILLLQRPPRDSDIIYLLLFLGAVSYMAIFCTIFDFKPYTTSFEMYESLWKFFIPLNPFRYEYYLCSFSPFLHFIFALQVLRQFLNLVYLKQFKVPPLTEDYVLNDPEGLFRYPVDSPRWIQLRLYHQIRRNDSSALSQTWTQVKETLRKFNSKRIFIKLQILLLFSFKLMYFLLLVCLVVIFCKSYFTK